MRVFRRIQLVAVTLLASSVLAGDGVYLLVNQSEIDAARSKAKRHAWARDVLDGLVDQAERTLHEPVALPERGGQWPHWYSCKQDGVRLLTVSPTEHRCPVCNTVYRGDPYDAVVLYWVHTRYSRAVRDLGLAYRFTGRDEFARRARDILLGYAGRYNSYPLHDRFGKEKVGGGRIMAQTLDESVWLIPVAWGYSLVKDTLTEAEQRHVEKDLLRAAADVIRAHRMGIHNIQCWKNSAVGLAGFATGDHDLTAEAIDDPERGFRVQIEKGVTADGLWHEGSLGYHHYTMRALLPLAEAARHAGIDLYTDRYRSLYDAPIALALPNGDPPGFNDSAGGNLRGAGSLYEVAYARWRRTEHGRLLTHTGRDSVEALLYGAGAIPEGPMVPNASTLLRDAGYAVLRSPAMVAAVRFGMHGGGHGHPDKLNIVTYGAGHQGGLDPGSINYGVPLHREWYRSTIAHNTVSVDQQPQRTTDGRLQQWSSEAGVTILVAAADEAYPGVQLRRSLRLTAEGMQDRFECSSDTEHTYDWAFHVPGRFTSDLELEPGPGSLGDANGYQHISSLYHGETGEGWWAAWEFGDARLTLRMDGAPGTEIFAGEGPGRKPEDRVSVIVVRRRVASTIFDATHEFTKLNRRKK